MAFSKDPEAYTSGEHQVLIEATTETVEVPCPDEKTAMHIRHRLYALRRAAIETYDKVLILEAVKKPTAHLLTPLVKCATALRGVTIGRSSDKLTLLVGRGAASTDVEEILTAALKKAGKEVRREQEEVAIEAFGEIDFSQEVASDEPVIPDEYSLSAILESTPPPEIPQIAGELSDAELIAKVERGEAPTPAENKRLQNMKHGEG